MQMKKKLIVISADAMVYEDLEFMATLPNYSEFIKNASMVERVRTIYPTVTYPAHTTMVSGCYPDRHGVISNEELTIGAPV